MNITPESDVMNLANMESGEVEIILDQHAKELEKQNARIFRLEETTNKILIAQGEMNVKLGHIENGQLKIEKRLLESSNEQKGFQQFLIDDNKKFQESLIEKLLEKDNIGDENTNKLLNKTYDEIWGIIGKFIVTIGSALAIIAALVKFIGN